MTVFYLLFFGMPLGFLIDYYCAHIIIKISEWFGLEFITEFGIVNVFALLVIISITKANTSNYQTQDIKRFESMTGREKITASISNHFTSAGIISIFWGSMYLIKIIFL